MEQHQIERINELARLSRERELTPQEQAERAKLRGQYIAEFRQSMEHTLQNVRIREKDGTLTELHKKDGPEGDA